MCKEKSAHHKWNKRPTHLLTYNTNPEKIGNYINITIESSSLSLSLWRTQEFSIIAFKYIQSRDGRVVWTLPVFELLYTAAR